jgi:hypothetical protein
MFVGNGLANVRRMSPPSRVIDETAVLPAGTTSDESGIVTPAGAVMRTAGRCPSSAVLHVERVVDARLEHLRAVVGLTRRVTDTLTVPAASAGAATPTTVRSPAMRATITSFAVCRMDAGADLFGSEPRGLRRWTCCS